MKPTLRKFKHILFTQILILLAVTAISQQIKHKSTVAKTTSNQLKAFYQLDAEANVVFIYPEGFKEIPVINNEDFSFDYAMVLPGHDFEIWFRVRSLKRNWEDYQLYSNDPTRSIENPDSLYNHIGLAQAISFTGDKNYFTTIIPKDVLARYNATAGKTYLLNLLDMRATKHYKYALLITLQKDHIGTIVAVCFANDKGSEFFKNISKASKCLKFKP